MIIRIHYSQNITQIEIEPHTYLVLKTGYLSNRVNNNNRKNLGLDEGSELDHSSIMLLLEMEK